MSAFGQHLPPSHCERHLSTAHKLRVVKLCEMFFFNADALERPPPALRSRRHRGGQLPGPGEQHRRPLPRQEQRRLGSWHRVRLVLSKYYKNFIIVN